jgi:hypothetical protein
MTPSIPHVSQLWMHACMLRQLHALHVLPVLTCVRRPAVDQVPPPFTVCPPAPPVVVDVFNYFYYTGPGADIVDPVSTLTALPECSPAGKATRHGVSVILPMTDMCFGCDQLAGWF